MNDDTRQLLFEVAGYLNLIAQGLPAQKQEAVDLLEKIGAQLAVASPPEAKEQP